MQELILSVRDFQAYSINAVKRYGKRNAPVQPMMQIQDGI